MVADVSVLEEMTVLERAKCLSQYYTSEKLARKVVEWSEISRGLKVLEPSAGDGGLLRHIPKNARIQAFDIDPENVKHLRELSHPALEVKCGDFLRMRPRQQNAVDLALMNPPYENGADGAHVAHGLRWAERVVALVRTNFEYGVERYHTVFRWAQVTRRAVLTRRPVFYGPADEGQTARHDYVVLELVRRVDRLEDPAPDQVETEYWTEDWKC